MKSLIITGVLTLTATSAFAYNDIDVAMYDESVKWNTTDIHVAMYDEAYPSNTILTIEDVNSMPATAAAPFDPYEDDHCGG